ncbi:spermidine synthase [Agromyces ramosus]|nr:fused MFS/spermidine synthase [Agromyces ramosus]
MAHPRIEFEADVFSPSGLTLLVDGSAQSHVDPVDPTHLFFEYVRRIGHVLDSVREAGRPIRALHLGGGAMTLPRYVAATRPGSSQVVVEVDAEVVATVLERLPVPTGADLALVLADARDAIAADGALAGVAPFDVVVVDLYTRLEAPAFVDDPTFMGGCLAALAPGGLVVVNVADAPGLTRLRAQARALARADPGAELLVAGDPATLAGTEEGNAILVAAPDGLPGGLADRIAAAGPFPAAVLTGHRLDAALWGAC